MFQFSENLFHFFVKYCGRFVKHIVFCRRSSQPVGEHQEGFEQKWQKRKKYSGSTAKYGNWTITSCLSEEVFQTEAFKPDYVRAHDSRPSLNQYQLPRESPHSPRNVSVVIFYSQEPPPSQNHHPSPQPLTHTKHTSITNSKNGLNHPSSINTNYVFYTLPDNHNYVGCLPMFRWPLKRHIYRIWPWSEVTFPLLGQI